MGIRQGCLVRAIAGLQTYDGLTIADFFISKKAGSSWPRRLLDDSARAYLAATMVRVNEALKAELMSEDTAYRVTKKINDTFDALDNKSYEKASESVMDASVIAMDEAMQKVVECEKEEIYES